MLFIHTRLTSTVTRAITGVATSCVRAEHGHSIHQEHEERSSKPPFTCPRGSPPPSTSGKVRTGRLTTDVPSKKTTSSSATTRMNSLSVVQESLSYPDDLTTRQPWIPLLSLLPSDPVPYLSLPCCLHTLDASFTHLEYKPPPHPHTPALGFEDGLEPGQSRYKAYLMWLGWCGLQCGWEWEKEGLRIPSTKGWGIVG